MLRRARHRRFQDHRYGDGLIFAASLARAAVDNPRQLSAKLHCLYGKPILSVGRGRSARTYTWARSFVYDLRMRSRLTRWGPLMNDMSGRVDWQKMEAIIIVLGHNISGLGFYSKIFKDIWGFPFSGSWPNSYLPPARSLSTPLSSLDSEDPYGISGTWYWVCGLLFPLKRYSGHKDGSL